MLDMKNSLSLVLFLIFLFSYLVKLMRSLAYYVE